MADTVQIAALLNSAEKVLELPDRLNVAEEKHVEIEVEIKKIREWGDEVACKLEALTEAVKAHEGLECGGSSRIEEAIVVADEIDKVRVIDTCGTKATISEKFSAVDSSIDDLDGRVAELEQNDDPVSEEQIESMIEDYLGNADVCDEDRVRELAQEIVDDCEFVRDDVVADVIKDNRSLLQQIEEQKSEIDLLKVQVIKLEETLAKVVAWTQGVRP